MNLIEECFPKLRSGNYRVTSPPTNRYNCIAWAANDVSRWWWPLGDARYYWPPEASRATTLSAFVAALQSVGFEPCDGTSFDPTFEYAALFADSSGSPTHAARQLPNGQWSSKLGEVEDIEHDLRDLEGDLYGTVAAFLKRVRPSA